MEDIFDPCYREDGLDFFIPQSESTDFQTVLKSARHIGWLSMRDFAFLHDFVTNVKEKDIRFDLYYTGLLSIADIAKMNDELNMFVGKRTEVNKSDIEQNYSVRRLRSILHSAIQNNSGLCLVSD